LIIKINHPDSASMRTGIVPVMKEPRKKYSKFSPDNACKAGMLLRAAITVTVVTVTIPFHRTGTNGISITAERIIIINDAIIVII